MIKRILIPAVLLILGACCACPLTGIKIPLLTSTPTLTHQTVVTPTRVPTTDLTPPATPQPNFDWNDLSIFEAGLVESQQKYLDTLHGASYYNISINIAEDLQHISGIEIVRYTNQEETALEAVHFRLYPNILGGWSTVSSVLVDGTTVSPEYGLENSLMIVPLSSPLQPGEAVIVQVDFQVFVPENGVQNYGVFALTRGVLALSHFYPDISVYNESGWNDEIPDDDGDVTFNDAAFYLVSVELPEGVIPVTAGREISRETNGDRLTVRFAAGPARDFYLAASRAYTLVSEQTGEVTVNCYAIPDNLPAMQKALDIAVDSLQTFSDLYAPYPYTEFDIVSISTMALGIEYPGLVAINRELFNSYSEEYPGELETTIAHEVGHQWYYNLVGDDQMDEPYLDESLSQFVTWQYYKAIHGANEAMEFEDQLRGWWYTASDRQMSIGMPVSAYDSFEYGAIVYGKGAFFFDAIREKMGDETFERFMKAYTEIFTWGIATTQGLKDVGEEFCNCNLQALFEEWVYPK